MSHPPTRKRENFPTSQTSNYSTECVSDSEWKNVLSRRQSCKERISKIRQGIDSATDTIKRWEDMNKCVKQKYDRPEAVYGGQPIAKNGILHRINPNSFISSQPLANSYHTSVGTSDSQSKINVTTSKEDTSGHSAIHQRNGPSTIPSRFAGLAKAQKKETQHSNRLISSDINSSSKLQHEGSVDSRKSSYSSSSGSRFDDPMSDFRSRSQSTVSNTSSNNPYRMSCLKEEKQKEKMINNIRNGLSDFDNIVNSKAIKALDKVVHDARIENENSKRIRFSSGVEKTLHNLKRSENYCSQKRYESSNYTESSSSIQKTTSNFSKNDLHDTKRPNLHSSLNDNNFLSEKLYSQLNDAKNNLNVSLCSPSDSFANKNIIQTHSSDVYNLTKTSYMNNKQLQDTNKNLESSNKSTRFNDNDNEAPFTCKKRSCNEEKESFKNDSHLSILSPNNSNLNRMTSSLQQNISNETRVNLNNCTTIDHNSSISTINEQKERQKFQLKFKYHDYEVDRTFNECFSSFLVKKPIPQTAKVIVSKLHPVSQICDNLESVLHCENLLSSFEKSDRNNNIFGIAASHKEGSNMASHLTFTQRFASFCDLSESTVNTLYFGKRKPNAIQDENKNSTNENNEHTRLIEKQDQEEQKNAANNIITLNRSIPDNELDETINYERNENEVNKSQQQNGTLSSSEDDEEESEWEYYSDDEYVPSTQEISKLYNSGNGRPNSISFPLSNKKDTFFIRHPALISRKEICNKEQWSPYIQDVTFDISPSRYPDVASDVNSLNEWIEEISKVESKNAFIDLNKNFHANCSNCNKNNFVNSDMNGEIDDDGKEEGIHIDYLKDPRTDEITEMHEVHYCNGVRHGYYRIFVPAIDGSNDDFTKFHSIGHYLNGKKVGASWNWMEGNCYFIDLSEENEEQALHDGFYLYPKLSSGIYGT